jgi:hypothetical protein
MPGMIALIAIFGVLYVGAMAGVALVLVAMGY